MLLESIIIAAIISGTTLIGYITRLCFLSKCTTCDIGCIHTTRNTGQESQNVSSMHLPVPFPKS